MHMAPPVTMIPRARELASALVEAGWKDRPLPRRIFDAYVAQHVGLGEQSIKNLVKTGRDLGLWDVTDGRAGTRALVVRGQHGSEVGHGVGVVNAGA